MTPLPKLVWTLVSFGRDGLPQFIVVVVSLSLTLNCWGLASNSFNLIAHSAPPLASNPNNDHLQCEDILIKPKYLPVSDIESQVLFNYSNAVKSPDKIQWQKYFCTFHILLAIHRETVVYFCPKIKVHFLNDSAWLGVNTERQRRESD